MLWLYISETLLYLCFSILIGAFIIHLFPENKRPSIEVNKRWLQLSILGIAIFSLMPVIRVILYLYEDVGFLLTFSDVFSGFEIGRAWSFSVIISIFFYLFVSIFPVLKSKLYTLISIMFTIILILALGWASHVASLTEWSGFIFHTLHFLATVVWVGIILMVSWFSVNHRNWIDFLNWFTPVAINCVVIIIASGFFMMSLVMDVKDYANAWTLSYGQSLLLKHLLVIPIILFAFINGIWMRKKLQLSENINPKPWAKVESIFLLLIFSATAVLGQQEPPHDVEVTVKGNRGAIALFNFFTDGSSQFPLPVELAINVMNISFFCLSFLFLVLTLLAFAKKAPAITAFFMSFFFVISMYLGIMTSIQ